MSSLQRLAICGTPMQFGSCTPILHGLARLTIPCLLIPLLLSITLLNAINDMPVIAAFQGEHHNSMYGYSMVSLDFNHDGLDDR